MNEAQVQFSHDKLSTSTELVRALAHPLRLKILEFIDQNDVFKVNAIYNELNIEQSLTSQHLKILRLAGVVNAEKNGKYMHYQINYEVVDRVQKAVHKFIDAETKYYAKANN